MNFIFSEPAPPEGLFEALVELDRVNMEAHFSASGARFDRAIRRRSLAQEWAKDAEFFVHYRDGALAGYCEVMPTDNGKLAVVSLQTDRRFSRSVTLRALLGAALLAIESNSHEVVASAAHSSNALSVKLHRGLGFEHKGCQKTDSGGERFVYEASLQALRRRLGVLVRTNTSVDRVCRTPRRGDFQD